MPRRNYRRPDAEAPLDPDRMRRGVERVQAQPDGDWLVRNVPAGDKTYRCPGCDQEIRPGSGHVVACRGGSSEMTIVYRPQFCGTAQRTGEDARAYTLPLFILLWWLPPSD